MIVLNWRAEEILVVNNEDNIECLCFGTTGLIVALWKFDVLKTSIFALEASLLGQIFVLRTLNFRGTTIRRKFVNRNTQLLKGALSRYLATFQKARRCLRIS